MKSVREKSLSLIINVKRRNSFIILLLLLFCLGVRLINFVGMGINDDIAYIQNARCLASPGCSPIRSGFNQLGFRLGMVFPLALLYKLFGYNNLGFSLYPLLSSLITCLLIYLTALRLWGRPAAVFASLLWIFYPLQVVFDTQLSPSNQHATCVIAALFLYFCAVPPKTAISESKFASSSKWREPVLLISSGVCLGIAWWMNEIFVTFIFVMIPFLLILKPKVKHLLWIIIGFILVILIEMLIVKVESGSWVARFTCILKTESAVVSNKDLGYLPRSLFKLWNIDFLHSEGRFGVIWYLFIGVTILTIFLKDKIPLALAMGSWLWLFYLEWGVQSPEGTPIAKYIRYISMIVPLQCLVFGALLGHFIRCSKKLKAVITSLFVILLIHLFWFGTSAVKMVRVRTEDFKEITTFILNLKLKEGEIVYTDDLTANFIRLYSKERLTVQKLNYSKISNPPAEGIIVVDGSWYVVKLHDYRNAIPPWFLAPPPPNWQLLYTVPGEKVWYYKEFDPKIYRVLPQNY